MISIKDYSAFAFQYPQIQFSDKKENLRWGAKGTTYHRVSTCLALRFRFSFSIMNHDQQACIIPLVSIFERGQSAPVFKS